MATRRRRPLTREESQARTREAVLEAAEETFLANGFHGTTIAQIAANASRTTGSIYGHFASKEALCLAVLERRYGQSFGELVVSVSQSGADLDDKLDAVAKWWQLLSANEALTLLVNEYGLAVKRDPAQFAQFAEFWASTKQFLRAVFAEHITPEADGEGAEALLDLVVVGVVSTAIGLAISQVATVVDNDQSGAFFAATMQMWVDRLKHSSGQQTI